MGKLDAIYAKVAAGEAGQLEAAILWQEVERLQSENAGLVSPAPVPATPEYTPEQISRWLEDGTVPVPQSARGKAIDALTRCIWLLSAPGVKTSRAMKGYQVDCVIGLAKDAIRAVATTQGTPEGAK